MFNSCYPKRSSKRWLPRVSALFISLSVTALPSLSYAETSQTNSTAAASAQPDYEREQRLANEVRDVLFDGEIIELNDGQKDFIAIQTDSEAENNKGIAIILHGRGFHPDWPDTINPLRTGLTEQGWTTLSVQMPVLHKQAKYYDYVPLFSNAAQRINATLQYAKQQNISPVALIAHSCGGHMAMHWVREQGDDGIDAFVGLGMGATDYKQFMEKPFPLDKMSVPVLDVYGSEEYPAVIRMAPDRLKQITTANHKKSAQTVIDGADHYFKDKGDELTGEIARWLDQL